MQVGPKLPDLAGPAPGACTQPPWCWQAAPASHQLELASTCSAFAESLPRNTSEGAVAAS